MHVHPRYKIQSGTSEQLQAPQSLVDLKDGQSLVYRIASNYGGRFKQCDEIGIQEHQN